MWEFLYNFYNVCNFNLKIVNFIFSGITNNNFLLSLAELTGGYLQIVFQPINHLLYLRKKKDFLLQDV